MSTSRITFTRPAADRIANVVRIVEQGSRDEAPLRFANVFERVDKLQIRAVTFTGSWFTNTLKVVTFQGITSTPNTVMATNQLFTIGDACVSQVAYIGRVSSPFPTAATASYHLLNVQHHETAVIVSVTLTTAALEFTRRLVFVPYPGETTTFAIQLATDTACSLPYSGGTATSS